MDPMQNNEEIPVPTNTTIPEPFLSVDLENIKSHASEGDDYDENISRHDQFLQEELNYLI